MSKTQKAQAAVVTPVTVQHVIAHSLLLEQLIGLFPAIDTLTPNQKLAIAEIANEANQVSTGIAQFGVQVGAGLFPNTYVKNGVYIFVNTPAEVMDAIANGFVVATFPETMVKPGFPDRVVHNTPQKNAALDAGYTLPGLPPIV
jgi:hypothetical protein